jgi:hypothetical protein
MYLHKVSAKHFLYFAKAPFRYNNRRNLDGRGRSLKHDNYWRVLQLRRWASVQQRSSFEYEIDSKKDGRQQRGQQQSKPKRGTSARGIGQKGDN